MPYAIFLDIETTGLDSFMHHAIEIAFKIVDVSTGELKKEYETIVKQPWEAWEKRDHSSVLINGFTWEKVCQGREIIAITSDIISLFTEVQIQRGKAVFVCQNPAFDRGFFAQLVNVYTQERLNWPYHWLDLASMYWTLVVKRSLQEGIPLPSELHLSKNEIARSFNLPEEQMPHRAINGVNHLIQCYEKVVGFLR